MRRAWKTATMLPDGIMIDRDTLPVACPVCSCERVDTDGRGINCVCHSCHSRFPLQLGRAAWQQLAAGLTGRPDVVELGDVVEYDEDPDARPYWIWDT